MLFRSTYQAHPIACAASLAVQQVIKDENLISSCLSQGAKFGNLLRESVRSDENPAKPFVFDVRGSGCFWAVEFSFNPTEIEGDFKELSERYDLTFGRKKFGAPVQSQCMKNGMNILGFSGGGDVDGKTGDHIVFAPPYNVTDQEIYEIVMRLEKSLKEVMETYRKS